ncbi:NADP-dependent oxidoreductase [Streptacidiphilus sp. P02-A3a]|uniref:NADP-dependent oxidoreductase n=1 Tax=Streptacidiphilus sp. P02-A3a TaxID=2704468 RepID=UPI0015F93549|nr:NADP-dependent oxidoreductase [Streptacidiphilus sp. P02-A3a]QMU72046.1 NADP-dependent oxidoreductase [Streptacidiphilus sp. P02-A3a]
MPQAVRYDRFGELDVLRVVEVPRPVPGPGQVLVEVRAAGINPGESSIRRGQLHQRWPSTFPSGQGSDLAGVVVELGPEVSGFAVGDEVLGFTHDRASQADLVLARADRIVPKPASVSWEAAGALYVAGATAYAAVRAVGLRAGDTVVVAGAAGGVGSLTVQLARNAGAVVIGVAGADNHDWLRGHGVLPVAYGEGLADRIRAAADGPVDAFIDLFGADYVKLAIELGVPRDRIDTIINFADAEAYGVKSEGSNEASTAEVLGILAGLLDQGTLEVPIAAVYPLSEVQEAFRELEKRHTRGKIVLRPGG